MDRNVLDAQKEGSDLHGLVKRVAYLVWMSNKASPPEVHWNAAKTIIFGSGYGQVSSPERYHHTLEWTADDIRKARNTDQNTSWYLAQDHWAAQIFDNYSRNRKQN